ncbi:hypothetical protein GCM10010340_35200 [Streptomyces griseoloalbus]|nr:hypothetical protein GCM10010340_35200 [Streptomyces albaduncus]
MTAATDSARKATADPDGWHGLVRYLEESMRTQRDNCGLRGLVITTIPSCPMVLKSRAKSPAGAADGGQGAEAGHTPPDFDATDLTYIQVALAAIMEATHDTSPDLYRHHLKLFIDGMRAVGPRALPSDHLTPNRMIFDVAGSLPGRRSNRGTALQRAFIAPGTWRGAT